MSKKFYLDLNSEKLKLLDERRGDLSREEFILKILNEHVNDSNEKNIFTLDDIKSSVDQDSGAEDIAFLIANFQEFANEINKRLDRLESIVSTNGAYSNSNEFEDFVPVPPEEEKDEDEQVIFELDPESVEDEVGETEELDTFTAEENNDEFEYGCPFCNSTIEKDAKMCPSCGNKFDDNVVDETDEGYSIIEPLDEGFSDSGEYDPRPGYLKGHQPSRDVPPITRAPPPRPSVASRTSVNNAPGEHVPGCSICGNNLVFVKEYRRWYCLKCKKYASVVVPVSGMQKKPAQDIGAEPIPPKKTTQRPRKPNWQPLKGYHRYS